MLVCLLYWGMNPEPHARQALHYWAMPPVLQLFLFWNRIPLRTRTCNLPVSASRLWLEAFVPRPGRYPSLPSVYPVVIPPCPLTDSPVVTCSAVFHAWPCHSPRGMSPLTVPSRSRYSSDWSGHLHNLMDSSSWSSPWPLGTGRQESQNCWYWETLTHWATPSPGPVIVHHHPRLWLRG